MSNDVLATAVNGVVGIVKLEVYTALATVLKFEIYPTKGAPVPSKSFPIYTEVLDMFAVIVAVVTSA